MEGYALVALFVVVAIVLLVAEMFLPAHGAIGLLGLVALVASVVVCLRQNAWAGLGLTLGLVALSPVMWSMVVKIWPRTPMGRRMILSSVTPPPPKSQVYVGQRGVAISELRPGGVCELDDGTRLEAQSEHGIVPAGSTVQVIAVADGKPTVRKVA